jgi:hypothetical protein
MLVSRFLARPAYILTWMLAGALALVGSCIEPAQAAPLSVSAKSGQVTISAEYWARMNQNDALQVLITPTPDLDVGCLQPYLDFEYTLRDSSGKVVPTRPDLLSNPPFAAPLAGGAFLPGGCVPKGTANRVRVAIDKIYPNLPSGTYTLDMVFKPQKYPNVIALPLPAITFQYVNMVYRSAGA